MNRGKLNKTRVLFQPSRTVCWAARVPLIEVIDSSVASSVHSEVVRLGNRSMQARSDGSPPIQR